MKLTPWYDGCQKPVRAGLYRRGFPLIGTWLWSYWNGAEWSISGGTKRVALLVAGIRSSEQCLPWRGIAGPEL